MNRGALNRYLFRFVSSYHTINLFYLLFISQLFDIYAQTHLTTFGRILELKTNQNYQDLIVGDFNGDGLDDLAIYGGSSIQLLLQNDTSLSWQSKNVNIKKTIIRAVAVQCNNDRYTDIVIATEDPNELQVFLARPQFPSQPRWKQVLEFPFEKFTVADINNDGKVDILLYGKRMPGIIVYSGRGDGTFISGATFFSDYSFNMLHISDWNRDGINDIFASHWISNEVLIFSGFGRMKFSEPARLSFSSEPSFLTTANFDTDESTDLVVGFTEDRLCEIMFGDGLGNFRQSQILQLENFPTAILTGDMNRDGKTDIGILNETEQSFSVRLNDGNGLFHSEVNFSAGKNPTTAQLFRHRKKNIVNLVILDQAFPRLRIFYNADFENYFSSEQIYSAGLQPTNVVSIDVDRNGWNDILVGNKRSPHVSLYLNKGNGTFGGQISFQGSIEPQSLQSYQKNESTLVVLTSNPEEKMISVLEIDNRHYSSMSYNLSISEGSELLAAYIDESSQYLNIYNYEHNVDGKSLIIKFEQFASTRFIERTYTLNTKSPPLTITAGYFNNDRLLDLAYVAFDMKRKKEEVYQINNFEQEPFSSGWLIHSYDEPAAVSPIMWNADINGDALTDLIVYFPEPKNILTFFLGRKDTSFSSPRFQLEDISVIHSREQLKLIDMNGDHHNDIIIGNTFGKIIEVYLGKGNGTFYRRTRLSSMENFGGFTLKDIDNDAIPELIMTDAVKGILKIITLQN